MLALLPKDQWIDSHCHLTDPRLDLIRDEWIEQATEIGINFFLQGGIDPEDWERQRLLAKAYPQNIGLCFGVHPYWVASHSLEECEAALDKLAREGADPQCLALGELGLDLRPQIAQDLEHGDSEERQIEVFGMQLEIAEFLNKPIVLHLVQAYEQTRTLLTHWKLPKRLGFVHSFSGSWTQAQEYLELGLSLSVGGPLCRPNRQQLREVVSKMPLDRLLLETDAPDQAPHRLRGELNPLSTLFEVANTVGQIRKMDPLEILRISKNNFINLIGPPPC
jgi:TatD DNase family protein